MTLDEFVQKFRNRIFLYHFTDTRNLESIREHGLLSLRELRKQKIEIPAAGGNQWSHDSAVQQGLDGYISLCFRQQHPMEYKARKEGLLNATRFLKVDLDVLSSRGVAFTAGVSNKSDVPLLGWTEAVKQFDWEVLYMKTDWKDPNIQARLRRAEKYEALIPSRIVTKLIKNL